MDDDQYDKELKLIQVLLDEKLISSAQADLAKSDREVSGMTLAEVLLARRWVTQPTLDRIAPWLENPVMEPSVVTKNQSDDRSDKPDDVYDKNLKRYREIMRRILDEK